jgi:hypothetical protein
MSEHDLEVEVDGDLIVVSQLETQFVAIYARRRTSLAIGHFGVEPKLRRLARLTA